MEVIMQVFYPEGDPDGVVRIKKLTGSGAAIAFPRRLCDDVCRNKGLIDRMFKWHCVYVLWSPDADNHRPEFYVGESNGRFNRRIKNRDHMSKKWTRAVVYTDTDGGLSASQIEARLVQCAKSAKGYKLRNAQNPRNLSQNDADAAVTKGHLYDLIHFFLPLAGCDFFRQHDETLAEQESQKTARAAKPASVAVATSASADLYLNTRKVKARGREKDGGFWVYAESQAAKDVKPTFHEPAYKRFAAERDKLINQGILVPDGDNVYRFKRGHLFVAKSMSGAKHFAATVILGRNAIGGNWQPAPKGASPRGEK